MVEDGEPLPTGSSAILDSSVLIAMGGPSTGRYQAFERHVVQRNIEVLIPDLVAEELGESPESYSYHRDRLRAARNAGWLARAAVDFSNPRVSETVDRTRTRMAKLSADDVREDEIEKTDTVLAGLAYQYATSEANQVTILVSDRIAEQAIEDVLLAMGVSDETSVLEGRAFLETLLDQQPG